MAKYLILKSIITTVRYSDAGNQSAHLEPKMSKDGKTWAVVEFSSDEGKLNAAKLEMKGFIEPYTAASEKALIKAQQARLAGNTPQESVTALEDENKQLRAELDRLTAATGKAK